MFHKRLTAALCCVLLLAITTIIPIGRVHAAPLLDEPIDQTAPQLGSIIRANANPTAAAFVDFTVTFSEDVTGVDTADFSLTTTGVSSPTISSVTGTGSTRTVLVSTGLNSGTIRVDLPVTATITDLAGNSLTSLPYIRGETYTMDKPSVSSITRADSNPTGNTQVSFTVNFSESVSGVDTSDFTLNTTGVTGASVASVSGSGAIYTVIVNTGSGDGSIRLDLLDIDDSIVDVNSHPLGGTGGGNGSFNAGESYTIDKTAPPVVSILLASTNPTAASSVDFTVTFSEAVSMVDTADFSLTTEGVTGASVSNVSGTGSTRTVSVSTGSGSGTIRLDLPVTATITDLYGNAFTSNVPYTSGESYAVDKPSVSSITRVDANPTGKTQASFTVNFSEFVSGVDTSDFTLSASGVTDASIVSATGTSSTYTVVVNTGTGDGSIRLDLVDNDSIVDIYSHPLGGTSIDNGSFNTGEIYTVTKSLTVTSASIYDGWLREWSQTSGVGSWLNKSAGVFYIGDDTGRRQLRGLLSFSTASLPDTAVITSVFLKLKRSHLVGSDPVTVLQGFMIDIKTGFFGTAAALQESDFQAAASQTLGPSKPALISGGYTINLTNGKTSINKLATNGGLTQIRLRFTLDDNNDTLNNYIGLYSGDSGVANRPQLVITYYVP